MEYTITLQGKQYPARFVLRTALLAAERRGGSIAKMLSNQNQAELLADIPWLTVEMIKAGAAIREHETGIVTKEIPTEDSILDGYDYADLLDLQRQLLAVINKDKPTVSAEGDPKNTDATPEV